MSWVQYLTAFCAVVSACCAVYVTWRSARWRESDAFKETLSEAAAAWSRSPEALALDGRVDHVEQRLTVCETNMQNMPTSTDLAAVRGEVLALNRLLEAMERGVGRIEGIMMTERVAR